MQTSRIVNTSIAFVLICYRVYILTDLGSKSIESCNSKMNKPAPLNNTGVISDYGACENGVRSYFDAKSKRTYKTISCDQNSAYFTETAECLYSTEVFDSLPQASYQVFALFLIVITSIVDIPLLTRCTFIFTTIFEVNGQFFSSPWVVGATFIASVFGNQIIMLMCDTMDAKDLFGTPRKRSSKGKFL